MTEHHNHAHHAARRRDDAETPPQMGWEVADLVAVGVLDAVTGQPPVPISVWRATGPDDPPANPADLYAGLTPRVAAILVAIYTDPDDLILDATDDPVVAGAAGAGGRRYQALAPPTATKAGSGAHGAHGAPGVRTAGLVLLRWPPPGQTHGAAVLEMCAGALTADGHTVVILAPPAGGIYRDHARELITAATTAGLGYLQHVVVITGTEPTAPDVPDVPDDGSASVSRCEHLDLLVLVLRPTPAAGAGRRS